jgi:hypothetical protein
VVRCVAPYFDTQNNELLRLHNRCFFNAAMRQAHGSAEFFGKARAAAEKLLLRDLTEIG